jgi:hypothetical protein
VAPQEKGSLPKEMAVLLEGLMDDQTKTTNV